MSKNVEKQFLQLFENFIQTYKISKKIKQVIRVNLNIGFRLNGTQYFVEKKNFERYWNISEKPNGNFSNYFPLLFYSVFGTLTNSFN